jgi:hypothetical protein
MTVIDLGAVREAKREPVPELVAMCDELLARCSSGEVRGALVFIFQEQEHAAAVCSRGEMRFGSALAEFEIWKAKIVRAMEEQR